jgi:DNA repair protein RecO (recombination protein O)
MSRSTQRVALASGYVLRRQPYRDTSLIIEILARDYGRLTVFARGVRGPRPRFGALQPFQSLLLSWSGRGEAPQLTGAELVAPLPMLPPEHLMSAFYLNELLLQLTTRHDPNAELFDCYGAALDGLRAGAPPEPLLRRFEKRLLDLIGYGLDLTVEMNSGRPVRAEGQYCFRGGHGVVAADERVGEGPAAYAAGTPPAASPVIAGHVLLQLAAGDTLVAAADLRQARALMRCALDHCLEGRELRTRRVARSMEHSHR